MMMLPEKMLLVQELCKRIGKQIRDFNFYNVQTLETKPHELAQGHVVGKQDNASRQTMTSKENDAQNLYTPTNVPLPTEETCICSANANKSTGDMDITEKIHSLEERIKLLERSLEKRLDTIEDTNKAILKAICNLVRQEVSGSLKNKETMS
ncbi:hypothetical protein JHK82_047789 [Glycine max]|nr:hypothetical protein JHK86_047672 [Glycine max]KAG4943644.1 hypothetical protein JHK85_048290 [Glycine max]KAG5097935.1 hypothetical protein JHK82_047789 [Glycine max]KAG5102728.1 hypothetical protein JHK84_047697 [Glycine max]